MTEVLSVLRFIGTMLLVLLVFNLMILVHEWGHFLAARWRGLKIEKFQIWMGNPIWKRTWNGVQYGLGWLPLGGFVALPQMAPMEAIEGKADGKVERLAPIKPIDKIIVAFAGPLFSALLALAFAVLVSAVGKPQHPSERTTEIGYINPEMAAAKSELKLGDKILQIDGKTVTTFTGLYGSVQWAIASSQTNPIEFLVERPGQPAPIMVKVVADMSSDPDFVAHEKKSWWQKTIGRPPLRRVGIAPPSECKVDKVLEGSPAAEAGLQKGDIITKVAGQPVLNSPAAVGYLAEKGGGKPIALTVIRAGNPLELSLTPRIPVQPADVTIPLTGIGYELIDPNAIIMDKPNPFRLVYTAGANTVSTLYALFSPGSQVKPSHMNGPVGILNLYYNIFQSDYAFNLVLYFSVILNVSLALFNLLPLPVLDGGHITLGLVEMIRGRAANLKILEYIQVACVLMLLGFVVFVSLKDVGGIAENSTGKETEIKFGPPQPPVAPTPVPLPAAPN